MKTMRNRTAKYFLTFSLLWLTACMGQATIPEDHYYRLSEISPDKHFAKPVINGTLGVELFQLDGIPNTRSILYLDPTHPNELKQYHYRHWVDSPAKLINTSLVGFLRKAGVAKDVRRASDKAPMDYIISGKIIRFERIMESGGPRIVVKLAVRIDSTQNAQSGKNRIYQTSILANSKAMDATVAAFGEALQTLFQTLLKDISDTK